MTTGTMYPHLVYTVPGTVEVRFRGKNKIYNSFPGQNRAICAVAVPSKSDQDIQTNKGKFVNFFGVKEKCTEHAETGTVGNYRFAIG